MARVGATLAHRSSGAPSQSVALAVASNGFPAVAPFESPPGTGGGATQESPSAKRDSVNTAPRDKPAARVPSLALSVDPSPVRSDDHFAEIRLSRNIVQKNSSFTWWTEPATAKPEVDYVPESVAIQSFPSGFRATRLYVRLLPQSLRSQRSYFYIAIAEAGPHQTPARVIRRQVWLPTSSNLQAKR